MTLLKVALGAGILIFAVAMAGAWDTTAELAGKALDVVLWYFEQAARLGD